MLYGKRIITVFTHISNDFENTEYEAEIETISKYNRDQHSSSHSIKFSSVPLVALKNLVLDVFLFFSCFCNVIQYASSTKIVSLYTRLILNMNRSFWMQFSF